VFDLIIFAVEGSSEVITTLRDHSSYNELMLVDLGLDNSAKFEEMLKLYGDNLTVSIGVDGTYVLSIYDSFGAELYWHRPQSLEDCQTVERDDHLATNFFHFGCFLRRTCLGKVSHGYKSKRSSVCNCPSLPPN